MVAQYRIWQESDVSEEKKRHAMLVYAYVAVNKVVRFCCMLQKMWFFFIVNVFCKLKCTGWLILLY